MYKSYIGEVLKLGELLSVYYIFYFKLWYFLLLIIYIGYYEWLILVLGYLVVVLWLIKFSWKWK